MNTDKIEIPSLEELRNAKSSVPVSTIMPELVGTTTNLMVQPGASSGPRVTMQAAHYAQTPQIVGAEPRTLFVGFEKQYAKYMFNVIVEESCTVIGITERRAKAFKTGDCLEKIVWVELHDAQRTVSCIIIPMYESNHQYFGFSYILTKHGKNIAVGDRLEKDTVLAETPSVVDGEFCNGVQANTILVSHPQLIEDATLMSDKLADDLNAWAFKTHRLFIGEKNVPLLPYGTADNPRIFPEVGDKVRDDGILFGTRPYDPLLAAVECSALALTEPCTHFDDCVIVDKEAIVYDIKVYRDDIKCFEGPDRGNKDKPENGAERPHTKMNTPSYIQAMLDEYYRGSALFYEEIRDYWKMLNRKRGKASGKKGAFVPLTPLAHQQIRDAIAINPEQLEGGRGYNRRKQFNKELMDDYVVEITIKYPIPMAVSGKLTDCMGGKGIAGEVRKRELMPYDDYGTYVDIMMSDNALLRRTNFNRPFECYINAATRDVTIRALELFDSGKHHEAWVYIISYCYVAAPEWAKVLEQVFATEQRQYDFVDSLHTSRLRMWIPCNTLKGMDEVERDVERYFPPRRSPLTFTMDDGTKVRTEASFIVGSLYIIRLDKTGRESFSISAGKYQQFGTIAKQHSADKYRRPIREQPLKFMGEAECRHLNAYTPQGTTAELHDRSNNPLVMDEILKSLLTHETPSNIDCAVDRTKFPLGRNRSMLIANHVLSCEGVKFTNRKGNIKLD